MKVLFVTGAAPPAGGSHATRVTAFVENLVSCGHRVTVLSVAWPDEMRRRSSLYGRLKRCAEVLEIDGGLLRRSADAVRQRSQKAEKGSGSLTARLFRWGKRVARKIAIPDSFVSWVPQAVRAGIRSGGRGCDVVASSGAPFSAHIAAWLIARRLGVPLVLDYGDPWVYEPGRPRSMLRRWIEHKLERRILLSASKVSVTTEATRLLYLDRYVEVPDKYSVLPMGYTSSDYSSFDGDYLGGARRRLVYAGRLNEEYRSLIGVKDFLAQAVETGVPFTLEFYGSEEHRVIAELGEFVELGCVQMFPALDHALYIELLCNACCVVVFGNNSEVQIPGKIAQILAAKRPVLYFANMHDLSMDPALALMKGCLQTGLFVFDGESSIGEFLAGLPDSVVEVNEARLLELEWGVVGHNFQDLVKDAAAQAGGAHNSQEI